ncbi:MAG TPA: sigma 54-interacting transcriptional regulator [Acidobacteriota bacterium]|nr:sigma 54-interacting transcriptional regulator [Acidobacteriota bacterium]
MEARILATSGYLKGLSYPLTTDEMIIGRDESNWICVNEESASRKHCIIVKSDAGFRIRDLGSRNGTFVNGMPIRERELQSGDRIECGDSVFLFLSHEDQNPATELPVKAMIAPPTATLRMEDAVYLEPERLLASAPFALRIVRGLDAILKLSRSIPTARTSSELFKKLLEAAFKVIPANKGAIVIPENDRIFSLDTNLNAAETTFRGYVKEKILHERLAIISNEIEKMSDVTSFIAAPMILHDVVMGILYLETNDSSIRFDDDHLQLACAIASIGSIALDGVRYWEEVGRDHENLINDLRAQNAIIGESKQIRQVYDLIGKVAPSDSTILISGETGTGKELVARAIHWSSPRRSKPFIAINCATLSETLLESELFGYEKGAFTGAVTQKKGKMELAEGGTLFLDEVAETSPSTQAKLLRALQEREIERLGGSAPVKLNLRIIAATNKDLHAAMNTGVFRSDLYYRLNVVEIRIPALRERIDDIPLLTTHFVSKYSRKLRRRVKEISFEAQRYLAAYKWPGNVRELENVIERAILIGAEELIVPEDLPETLLDSFAAERPSEIKYFDLLRETKKKLIREALEKAGGNHNEAAKLLGVHPANLHRMMRTLNLR